MCLSIKGITVAASLFLYISAMLFILLVPYLVQGASTNMGPVSSINNSSLVADNDMELTHCCPTWNIILSCLVTIFSCTGSLST